MAYQGGDNRDAGNSRVAKTTIRVWDKSTSSAKEEKEIVLSDSYYLGAGVGTNYFIFQNLTNVPLGVDNGQRLGRQIRITSIGLRLMVQPDVTQNAPNYEGSWPYRVALIIDTQTNGDNMLLSDYVDPIPGNTAASVTAWRNYENRDRFITIFDRTFMQNPQSSTRLGMSYLNFTKDCDVPVSFTGNTGQLQDIADNSFKLLIWNAYSTAINQNHWGYATYHYNVRVTYTG